MTANVVLETSRCVLMSSRFGPTTTVQYVQQDVAELLSDETVDDEVDGGIECQKSVRDGVSTP